MFSKKNSYPKSDGLVLLLIVCVMLAASAGCTPKIEEEEDIYPPPTIEEWVLPVVVSITGDYLDTGMAVAWGFTYGTNVVNEQGGIRGVPATFTIRDAASSDTQVISEIGLVAPEALIVMGPPEEDLYKAGQLAFYSARMPVVGAATDNENRAAYKPYAISCISNPGSEAITAVYYWVEAGPFSSVYIFTSPLFSERNDSAKAAFSAYEIEIVDEAIISNESFDAAGAAEKAFELQPDAYYIDLDGENALRLIRHLKYLAGDDAGKMNILCGPGLADVSFLEPMEEDEVIGIGARVWATFDPNKDSEKRKVFDETFKKNVDDNSYYSIAVDYYQSALMIKQAIETLGLMGSSIALEKERESLAEYLYNSDTFTTDQGDFIMVDGNKVTVAKLYRITENGFEL